MEKNKKTKITAIFVDAEGVRWLTFFKGSKLIIATYQSSKDVLETILNLGYTVVYSTKDPTEKQIRMVERSVST